MARCMADLTKPDLSITYVSRMKRKIGGNIGAVKGPCLKQAVEWCTWQWNNVDRAHPECRSQTLRDGCTLLGKMG